MKLETKPDTIQLTLSLLIRHMNTDELVGLARHLDGGDADRLLDGLNDHLMKVRSSLFAGAPTCQSPVVNEASGLLETCGALLKRQKRMYCSNVCRVRAQRAHLSGTKKQKLVIGRKS